MKRFYVTVNGNKYEVEVEEVKGEFSTETAYRTAPVAHKVSEAKPVTAERTVSVEKPAAEQKIEKSPAVPKLNGDPIECPMPGTILRIGVSEGSSVKKGDVMFILEAMKMENEIMAPRDGKVVKINVERGASVNTGDVLALLQN